MMIFGPDMMICGRLLRIPCAIPIISFGTAAVSCGMDLIRPSISDLTSFAPDSMILGKFVISAVTRFSIILGATSSRRGTASMIPSARVRMILSAASTSLPMLSGFVSVSAISSIASVAAGISSGMASEMPCTSETITSMPVCTICGRRSISAGTRIPMTVGATLPSTARTAGSAAISPAIGLVAPSMSEGRTDSSSAGSCSLAVPTRDVTASTIRGSNS